MSDIVDWMPEAREIAAQCWGDEETSGKEMDATLAEAVARRIAAWMTTAAEYSSNADYWRQRATKLEAELAALKAGIPEGWVMVPKEPTPEMVEAAYRSAVVEELAPIWDAMLAAAPKYGDKE